MTNPSDIAEWLPLMLVSTGAFALILTAIITILKDKR